MKIIARHAPVLALLAVFAGGMPVRAAELELARTVANFKVLARFDRNPPVKGDNNLEIAIIGPAGEALAGAKVLVNYYMPPMPRMPPMNYKKEAKPKKDKYTLKMDLIMEGPWIVLVKFAAGEKPVTAKFNIDVR